MSLRLLCSTPVRSLACVALLAGAATAAHAEMRLSKVCSTAARDLDVPGAIQAPADVCYSGFGCLVGLRGDWLDITHDVTFAPARGGSAQSATGYIEGKGAGAGGICVPITARDREGYVLIRVRDMRGHGRLRITAHRAGTLGVGTHTDTYDLDVRDGTRYLAPYPARPLDLRVGQVKTVELSGLGLQGLRLKPQPVALAYTTSSAARTPRTAAAIAALRAQGGVRATAQLSMPGHVRALSSSTGTPPVGGTPPPTTPPAAVPEVRLIGATPLMVRLQLRFDREGIFSLEDYLEFADGEPPINRDLGWPLIDVKP